jgi:3-hydroxyisobutyrate dehydrogenase-like beta-hydroxyacid dehydrogenase
MAAAPQAGSEIRSVGFIGLGVMGEPMCIRLAQLSGREVVAYDRDAVVLRRAREHGIVAAASAGEVMDRCEVVFLCLPSGEIVSELAHGADGLLARARKGQVVVDASTSSVDSTRELAAAFEARGVDFLDAPIARTRAAAQAGTLLVMVGGSVEVFQRVRPLIETFATDIAHCGGVGCGQVVKILNNMILFEIGVALAEAKAIGARSGVDPQLLFETLAKGSSDSFALRNHGMKAILPGEFPLRAFSVEYARKDLRYALRLAQDVNVEADGARHVDALFDRAIAAGKGGQYWPVISEVVGAD